MTNPFTIYFAGDLFDHKHLVGNAMLATYIERDSGGRYQCFVPQDLEHPAIRGIDVRNNDLKHVMLSDLGLFNFDGADLDSGTAAEFMYAKALDIPAVILRSDLRSRDGKTDRNDWNLMLSFYPRTKIVQFNAMAWYRSIQQSSDSLDDILEQLYTKIAAPVIEALDAARAKPPLPKGDPTQIEAWYRWALEYPGSGLTEFCGEPNFIKDVVMAKIEKGLL